MPQVKIKHQRITLVAAIILIIATVLVALSVLLVTAHHTRNLLGKSMELSLASHLQRTQSEIDVAHDRTRMMATHPWLIDAMARPKSADKDAASLAPFLSAGMTAAALVDAQGRELARSGAFMTSAGPGLSLELPEQARLTWDGQLWLQVEVQIRQDGRVLGKLITQTLLSSMADVVKELDLLGKTAELALCARLGAQMQCFSARRPPEALALPDRASEGVALPVSRALAGLSGVITVRDQRQQEVVAAYAPVARLGLAMVLEIGSAELHKPLWSPVRELIPLLACMLVLTLLALRWRLTPLVISMVGWQAQAVSESLRDSELRGRALLDNVGEAIVSTSEEGVIELFNPAAEAIFGYRSEEVVGRSISVLMPEPYRSEHAGYLAGYLQGGMGKIIGMGRELKGLRRNGGIFPMYLRVSEFRLAGKRHYIAIMRDITESRRITEALRASEMQLRQITDTVPALIAYLDEEQRFRFHNKSYEELFGLSFEQINGHTLAEVVGSSVYAGVRDKVEEVLNGYTVRYERLHTPAKGQPKIYAMQYFPRYGEGAQEGQVTGFFSLGTDITELKRIDRMKTEFISTVSHELRTPLTSIRGSLGLVAGGVGGKLPEGAKKLVDIANTNCERLIRLVNNILDSEKIEAGKMHLNLQVVDITQLVGQALAAIEGFAAEHRVSLRLRVPEETLKVRIDSDRMIQVLTNLLSNAVKFSPSGEEVLVNVLRVSQGVRIEVVDHGSGIPQEFHSRIFQKFSQADSSDTREKGGTGLGLNISRALLQNMGGEIGFSSQAGSGATFFLELPQWSGTQTPSENP